MTQVTPPGWYPDPGQKSDGPPTERWWDGKAWTDQVRPAGSTDVWGPPEQLAAGGAYPVHPGYPGLPQQGGRRGLRTGIAVGVAAVVLASIGVGVYALTADDGSGGGSANSQQQGPGGQGGQGGPGGGQGGPFGDSGGGNGGSGGGDGGSGGGDGGSGGQSPAPGQSEAPKVDSGSVTDAVSGISLPIPDGWYGQQISWGAHVGSDKTYKCPSDTSQTCMKGGAYSAPALALRTKGDTAEEVAKADIAANAEESYGKGYGEITSHEVLASKAVTVAGQKGYLVRWKAVTSKGSDGYVESLAFPSPASEQQIVVVRLGVDVDEGQSVLDEIAKGIKVSTGGGNGQDI
ncbi:membrane protein [Streptomyces viridochromogenes]|uniref:Membrane protein n=1 Tax=Streptomyces viridochromogenes TaxID=1938 RepID=A0A0J7ZH00_STRVR|nr:DUF2510 domain-containing protein [Streptomyces viridochromogenes]KMS75154.1 membrane protein [Streptomyces viridochromogenes]